MRLIDADLLEDQFGISDEDLLALDEIRHAPTVDAVVVTRCKGCAYGDPTWAGYVCNCNEYAALESTLYHDENFFCAYGKPEEETP